MPTLGLVQTTLPEHEVVRAAVEGDPDIVAAVEADRRRLLRFPPESALAILEGEGADEFAARLSGASQTDVVRHRDRWLVRAPDAETLADCLAATERPAGAKLRIEVDPPRI